MPRGAQTADRQKRDDGTVVWQGIETAGGRRRDTVQQIRRDACRLAHSQIGLARRRQCNRHAPRGRARHLLQQACADRQRDQRVVCRPRSPPGRGSRRRPRARQLPRRKALRSRNDVRHNQPDGKHRGGRRNPALHREDALASGLPPLDAPRREIDDRKCPASECRPGPAVARTEPATRSSARFRRPARWHRSPCASVNGRGRARREAVADGPCRRTATPAS
jgi:hypothetical protein